MYPKPCSIYLRGAICFLGVWLAVLLELVNRVKDSRI